MLIQRYEIFLKTSARTDMIDLTGQVQEKLDKSEITNGILLVFVPGATASLTTIEYESGVLNDLARAIERLAPEGINYEHDLRWGDGNGYSHVRAALLKPSLSVPVIDGRLTLGTWQQIVLLDFDNRPRERRILIQVIGEGN
ncbi:MAG: YjbQ family protein [Deltaproteobacteria bacterium]|nr:YjbQ family protein [Deltaproteobacteria bacterium]MBW2050955.1 YjbQ family protein [Deltaproteobacteria bacterium]MBW2139626.1 YjbQ family protein [Deltaproteobacteria bacterium]MBW2322262.1 YjbQ family protein [Deltaproteobacteria bacterium]